MRRVAIRLTHMAATYHNHGSPGKHEFKPMTAKARLTDDKVADVRVRHAANEAAQETE